MGKRGSAQAKLFASQIAVLEREQQQLVAMKASESEVKRVEAKLRVLRARMSEVGTL